MEEAKTGSYGTLPDGRVIERTILVHGRYRAEILDYGARLIHLSKDEGPNVAVAPTTIEDMLGAKRYAGPVIGPVINRIGGASAEIDGRVFSFEANQNDRHTLHSGNNATDTMTWSSVKADVNVANFDITIPDGALGFPGMMKIRARYQLNSDGLRLEIFGQTDAPTLMNPGHHGVWNPDGSGDWSDLRLEVPAKHYLPTDADKIPTGEIAPVQGSRYDHRAPRAPDPTLDHNFCFDDSFGLRARLIGKRQTLVIHSDAPGLQAYSGGVEGIALEPQLWPDAPHHPRFPSIELHPRPADDRFVQAHWPTDADFVQNSRYEILSA